jgi:hypothetical protein
MTVVRAKSPEGGDAELGSVRRLLTMTEEDILDLLAFIESDERP